MISDCLIKVLNVLLRTIFGWSTHARDVALSVYCYIFFVL